MFHHQLGHDHTATGKLNCTTISLSIQILYNNNNNQLNSYRYHTEGKPCIYIVTKLSKT